MGKPRAVAEMPRQGSAVARVPWHVLPASAPRSAPRSDRIVMDVSIPKLCIFVDEVGERLAVIDLGHGYAHLVPHGEEHTGAMERAIDTVPWNTSCSSFPPHQLDTAS